MNLIKKDKNILSLKRIALCSAVLYGLMFSSQLTYAGQKTEQKHEDQVLATYNNGTEVKESEVIGRFGSVIKQWLHKEDAKLTDLDTTTQIELVRNYISMQLITQEAEKNGINKSKEFKQKLHEFEVQLMQNELLQSYVTKNLTDAMIDDEYTKMANEIKGKKERKSMHILVENEEEAKNIRKKLNKNGDFEKLVIEYSKDPSAKLNNGVLDYHIQGALVPEFDEKLFSMKKGEISDPVQTSFGWHIIKMVDERPAQVPTKEQLLPTIRQKLAQELVKKYVDELLDKAKVDIKIKEVPVMQDLSAGEQSTATPLVGNKSKTSTDATQTPKDKKAQ